MCGADLRDCRGGTFKSQLGVVGMLQQLKHVRDIALSALIEFQRSENHGGAAS